MDIPEALKLLKKYSGELKYLRTLYHDKDERRLWKNEVNVVLEDAFGKNSIEYGMFNIILPIVVGLSDEAQQSNYLEDLNRDEIAIRGILQKYKKLGVEAKPAITPELPPTEYLSYAEILPKAFVSHGKESEALIKVEDLLRALDIEPLIVKDQPGLDETIEDRVNYHLSQADFVVILATGDDEIEGKLHPRQNVVREVNLAEKTCGGKIIYLLEEGAEPPPDINPQVWERFNQGNMENVFLRIIIELRGFRILMWPT